MMPPPPIVSWAADAWATWIAAVSLQLVPLTIVVLGLDGLLRRLGPSVRSALWWIVLLKLALPPGLASPIVPPAVLATIVPAATPAAVQPTQTAAWDWGACLALGVWLTGIAAAAIVARSRYRRVRARCLVGSQPAPPDVLRPAMAAARRIGLRALPPIRIHEEIGQPAVVGFLAPIVMLPHALVAAAGSTTSGAGRPRPYVCDHAGGRPESVDRVAPMDAEPSLVLEHVLLHELSHVRRGDPLACLVALIAQIVFWFHPAVWCARRRLATLREMACDRAVARALGDAAPAYRRTLLRLARPAMDAARAGRGVLSTVRAPAWQAGAPGTLGLFQRRAQIVARLDALARPIAMGRRAEQLSAALIALGVLVSCAPLASPRPPPSSPPIADANADAPATETTETPAFDVPSLDRLPGSLQKRYAVMRAIALEAQSVDKGTTHPRE